VAPIYNWTGFYIGANGGWGQSRNCWDFLDVAGVAFAEGCRERSGDLIGGQIGHRWQASQWVFGREAQGDWADLSNQRVSVIAPAFSTRVSTDGIGLFNGHIGYARNATLLYVKGGAAVTSNRFSIRSTITGAELASASDPLGVAPSALDLNAASHQTGRSVLNTTICSWATPITRSRSSIRSTPLS